MFHGLDLFAQAYDEGTYGAGNYEDKTSTNNISGSGSSTGSSSNSNDSNTGSSGSGSQTNKPGSNGSNGSSSNNNNQNTSGSVATPGDNQTNPTKNAGFDALLIGTAICVVLFIGLVIYFWRRHRKADQTETTTNLMN